MYIKCSQTAYLIKKHIQPYCHSHHSKKLYVFRGHTIWMNYQKGAQLICFGGKLIISYLQNANATTQIGIVQSAGL